MYHNDTTYTYYQPSASPLHMRRGALTPEPALFYPISDDLEDSNNDHSSAFLHSPPQYQMNRFEGMSRCPTPDPYPSSYPYEPPCVIMYMPTPQRIITTTPRHNGLHTPPPEESMHNQFKRQSHHESSSLLSLSLKCPSLGYAEETMQDKIKNFFSGPKSGANHESPNALKVELDVGGTLGGWGEWRNFEDQNQDGLEMLHRVVSYLALYSSRFQSASFTLLHRGDQPNAAQPRIVHHHPVYQIDLPQSFPNLIELQWTGDASALLASFSFNSISQTLTHLAVVGTRIPVVDCTFLRAFPNLGKLKLDTVCDSPSVLPASAPAPTPPQPYRSYTDNTNTNSHHHNNRLKNVTLTFSSTMALSPLLAALNLSPHHQFSTFHITVNSEETDASNVQEVGMTLLRTSWIAETLRCGGFVDVVVDGVAVDLIQEGSQKKRKKITAH